MKASPAIAIVALAAGVGCSGEPRGHASDPAGSNATKSTDAAQLDPTTPTAAPSAASPAVNHTSRCNEQSAQEFLQRAHLNQAAKTRTERAEMLKTLGDAMEYRTRQYGYFEGFGDRRHNSKSPAQQCKSTTFFGLPIVMHEKVIPVLACVEEQLKRNCSEFDYRPKNLSGLRRKNTYVNGEVSNHVYGIAIDIDPLKNPCCKCLEPWSSSERCRGNKTVWQRMAMPECWVNTFERFGFYWLGHDVLEDTMHFEFLGDPERIQATPDGQPEANR